MTIKTSGDLSISDIVAEFGGSSPHSLSEYYAGGSYVYSGATGTNGAIPSSGAISLSNFYGAVKRQTLTITSNQTDLNLRTWAVANGWDEVSQLEVVVGSGVYILASNTSNNALTVSGTFNAGVRLVNNGIILGYGGNAGNGGAGPNSGSVGQPGGTAIYVTSALTIVNNSTIAGGGGGGGGGPGSRYGEDWYEGGGGGGGAPYGLYGVHGTGSGPGYGFGTNGTSATLTTAGTYGDDGKVIAGRGGAGGGWGTAGETSGAVRIANGGNGVPQAGGAAGKYVNGNSYVTWETTGTRLGNVA